MLWRIKEQVIYPIWEKNESSLVSMVVVAVSCKKTKDEGRLGGSLSWVSSFGSGHDLAVREFEPRVGLCADSSEPGACFGFCVSLSLWPSPIHALSLSQKWINVKKKLKKKRKPKDEYESQNKVRWLVWYSDSSSSGGALWGPTLEHLYFFFH